LLRYLSGKAIEQKVILNIQIIILKPVINYKNIIDNHNESAHNSNNQIKSSFSRYQDSFN